MSTTLNDFNSKVNISKLVKNLELKGDLRINRIHPFGEFAYDPDFSRVMNAMDIMQRTLTPGEAYRTIMQDWKDELLYCDNAVWHQYTEDQIVKEVTRQELWMGIIENAQAEFLTRRHTFDKERLPLAAKYEEHGYLGAAVNGIGHISSAVMEAYPEIDWSAMKKYDYPVIMPYYHTPNKKHISYIDVFDAFDPYLKREKLWDPSYSGFAGTRGVILPNFKALLHRPGCTWDHTLDYWNNTLVTIDPECSIEHLLHILKTNKYTKFELGPIDIIKGKGMEAELYRQDILSTLDEELVLTLQEKLEVADLFTKWSDLQESQYKDGNTTYYKRNSGYYYFHKGIERQMTNFVLTLKGRKTVEKDVYYIIEAMCDNKHVVMTVPKSTLLSRSKFELFLIETFADNGLKSPRYMTTTVHKMFKYFLFHWFDRKSVSST